jgi:quercetin dioxygenase-like cupin family protein
MAKPSLSRRSFNRSAVFAVLAAAAAASPDGGTVARAAVPSDAARRRDVIRQALDGKPPRDLVLVEVTYPPGAGSPAHLHANGVMAFVVSGTIASKVGDDPERTFHVGEAWWEPPGAIHRVSRNASLVEPAVLLAVYVAPRGATPDDLMKPI